MKRYLLSLVTVFSTIYCCSAQNGIGQSSNQNPPSGPGSNSNPRSTRFENPGQTSMEIYSSDQIITFRTGEDFAGSKSIPNYYRIHVRYPHGPWMVTAKIVDQYSENGYVPMPEDYVSLVSLRDQSTGNVIRLSNVPQTIILCNNSLPENDYFVDLIVDPPFDMPTSTHRGIVSFQLTNQ